MLRRLIALLTGRSLATAKPAPADPAFWVQIGNSARRAEQIAACFPEYWKNRGSSHPERTARFCLARQLNEIPLDWNTPSCPTYLGTIESAIDPIAWCRINGNDVFSLEEAVQIAVIASQRKPEAKLRPFRRKFDEIARLDRNRERKKLRYSAGRPPTNPLFWRQLGHNPFHARRLVRCCPEYWFHRTKCSWRRAVALATRRLKRLAARLNSGRHDFYEAAETTEYEISKRDPVYWFSQGCDWNEAVHKVIDKLLHDRTDKCERIFRLRTLLRKAGHRQRSSATARSTLAAQPSAIRRSTSKSSNVVRRGSLLTGLPSRTGPAGDRCCSIPRGLPNPTAALWDRPPAARMFSSASSCNR